jgi:hypothetical protein
VQIVHSSRRGSRDIEHLGSAHDHAELELLKAAARQRIAAGQGELDLGLDTGAPGGPLPIIASRMGVLLDALARAWRVLGLDAAAGGDEVFFQLAAARVIEPVSKLDSARVLEEAGVASAPYRTVTRRLRAFAKDSFRQQIAAACAAHARLGPATLVLYDVSTLYFETDQGDGFREPGFSKERRLEPQITIGLLTGADGFPLMVSAFEGNRAETKTMLPVIESFMAAHQLPDVTVVADAGMVSDANRKDIEKAGLSFILGARIPDVPYPVAQWRRDHPGEPIPDGHIFTLRWPALDGEGRRDQVFYYQYKDDRARRTPASCGAVPGSASSNSSRRAFTCSGSHRDSDKKNCSRCTAASCAPATGSAPASAVSVLFRSRGASSPARYSRNPRRCARRPNRSSNRAAYPSSGPGATGHGRRRVITHPTAGLATTPWHNASLLRSQQTTASGCAR